MTYDWHSHPLKNTQPPTQTHTHLLTWHTDKSPGLVDLWHDTEHFNGTKLFGDAFMSVDDVKKKKVVYVCM